MSSRNRSVEKVNDTELMRNLTSGVVKYDEGPVDYTTREGSTSTVDLQSVNMSLKGYVITMLGALVMEAIYSLYLKHRREGKPGNLVFTALQVYQEMTKDKTHRPSRKKITEITDEIDKLRMTLIKLQLTDEYRFIHRIGPYELHHVDDNLLHVRAASYVYPENKKEVTAYELTSPMVLYTYAEATGKIVQYPTALLQMCDPASYTDDYIFILRQVIKELAKAKTTAVDIPYEGKDGIFTVLGYNQDTVPDWTGKKKNLKKILKKILESYIEHRVILSYEEYRPQNSTNRRIPFEGVRIFMEQDSFINLTD